MQQRKLSTDEILGVLDGKRKTIEGAKSELSRLEGVLHQQFAQLGELGYSSLEEAEAMLVKIDKDLLEMRADLQTKFEAFTAQLETIKMGVSDGYNRGDKRG